MSEELIERLDEFVDEHDYPGRSAVIREATRVLFEETAETDLENRALVGVVTVLFRYETTSVEERLMNLRHAHEDLVTANVHDHVGNRHCMELFVLEGDPEDISEFVGTIRGMTGTLRVSHSVLPVNEL
jgi:CopG family nickel-responsive transcriptional regulator